MVSLVRVWPRVGPLRQASEGSLFKKEMESKRACSAAEPLAGAGRALERCWQPGLVRREAGLL